MHTVLYKTANDVITIKFYKKTLHFKRNLHFSCRAHLHTFDLEMLLPTERKHYVNLLLNKIHFFLLTELIFKRSCCL